MQSSQESNQKPSTPTSMQGVPALPPELDPTRQRSDGGGGPSLEQIKALISPVAEASRRVADGGFQAPKVLPNPPSTLEPAKPDTISPNVEIDPLSFVPDLDKPLDKPEEKSAQPVEDTPKVEDKPADTEEDVPVDPKAENFKALRTMVKEVKTELQTTRSEAAKLKKQLEEYQTGAALPDVIKEKEARIAELEPLEHLHALRTSRLYHEKYIKPLTELQDKLRDLAMQYEIPQEALEEASQCQTQAELNRWLTDHFDPLGAQDARDIIRRVQTLQTEAAEAEKAPKTALASIIEEAKTAEAERKKEQLSAVHQSSRRGWVTALAAHKEEGLLPELILQPDDEEHNNRFVRPILTKAGADYGRIIKKMFDSGLRELPDDLAYAIASACQKAYATSVRGSIHDAALKHAEELAASAMEGRRYNRPAVGSVSGMSAQVTGSQERMTPEMAAKLSRERAAKK